MTWNHRVCKKTDHEYGETHYNIHEVYYDEDGNIEAWTKNPVTPFGNNLDEIRHELTWMLEALNVPVIDLDEQEILMNKRIEARDSSAGRALP